jgi:hypothetical protein
MTKTAQKPRERDGKIALVDCPRVCTVPDFPALCERLRLFTRTPHRSTVFRWVKNGTIPTVTQNGTTFILVHQYLKQLAVAF